MMKDILRTYAPALATGILLSFCFPVFHLYPLVWVAIVPLLYATRDMSPRAGAVHFFVAGFVFHSIVLQWFVADIMWAGGWAIIGQQLLCAVLSLFWAVMGAAWTWLRPRIPVVLGPFAIAVLWPAMEHLYGTIFSGFGWSTLGYSQGKDLALLQWAAIGTVPLVSLFIVAVNAWLAQAIADKTRRVTALASAVAVVGLSHGVGFLLLEDASIAPDPLNVGVFQSNFSLEMKQDREYTLDMVEHAARKSLLLAEHETVDLMIWPEALVMGNINIYPINDALRKLVEQGQFDLFTGVARFDDGRSYNSGYLMTRDGEIAGYYDKMHLAPWGEYIPMSNLIPFVAKLVPSIGNITPGTEVKVFDVDGRTLGPLICFEVVFPPMAEQLRQEGADFLVVITNLAWFGRSNAIRQELEIARVRAVETRLPLVHVSNTGISGVFDPWGRFTMIDRIADRTGRLQTVRDGLPPSALIMQRLLGAFELPEPGRRPVPFRPDYVPWVLVAASVLMLALAGYFGRPPAGEVKESG